MSDSFAVVWYRRRGVQCVLLLLLLIAVLCSVDSVDVAYV